jgi:hypothetical protein
MTTILHKRGTGTPPADQLKVGEIAIDTLAGKLYTKQSDGTVVEIGGGISAVSENQNIDGGNAASVYTLDQVIDGGSA